MVDEKPAEALPRGTLTMLFSDIEGSTALLTRLGTERYATVLSIQRRLVREAITAFGGHELGTEGDSHFVVFSSAADAVSTAVQAQRALSTQAWPEDAPVRVRIGMHTGEPEPHEDAYVGIAVHRAARVAAAAHGGQVLITAATWELVAGSLPSGVVAEDVGEHRLKDLPAPERLRRLVIEGVPDVATPPKGLGTAASLPQPSTPLVGRANELEMLLGFLAEGRQLVTLVGPGGVGKTRLALETAVRAAARFPGGVHFVDLSSVTDAELAWSQLAQVLPTEPDVVDAEGPHEAVARYVTDRRCLLVLDNLEQVRGGDRVVAELAADVGNGVLLVTSRQPVKLVGEQELPVEPLPLPEPDAVGAVEGESPASVQLFLQHARRVRPSLMPSPQDRADIGRICRTLDGLPLA
ncbi:MAG: adenylate/guanylate cyclase domain-containing protein, partial [Nocardioidaceae bacterium]